MNRQRVNGESGRCSLGHGDVELFGPACPLVVDPFVLVYRCGLVWIEMSRLSALYIACFICTSLDKAKDTSKVKVEKEITYS